MPEAPVSFRDHVSNQDMDGHRRWLYPRVVAGPLYRYRSYVAYGLLAFLFVMPWVSVNGHPLFLFNVLERRFIFFGVPFFPQDFYLVAIGLLTFIVFIIVFTVAYGRVFCGWVCPQTIFLEMVFRKIEIWIEGDYKARQRLDDGPLTREKFLKKTLKHGLYLLISFAIANTFLAYVIGKDELLRLQTDNPLNHLGGLTALLVFTGAFYFVFARFRELVCIVVCPYGRLQGVMLDRRSIVVAYDPCLLYTSPSPRD